MATTATGKRLIIGTDGRPTLGAIGIVATVTLAAGLMPLPRGCDPRTSRGTEVDADAYVGLGVFAGTQTRAEIEAALGVIDPEGGLRPHFDLTDDAIVIRRTPDDGDPVRIALRPHPAPNTPWARQRIAIDPGHFGGAWSERENRHIVETGGRPVREGDLSWATARLIEDDLRRAGKTVTLTRSAPPDAPFPGGSEAGFDVAREASYRLAEQRPEVFPWLSPLSAGRLAWSHRRLIIDTPFELYQRYDLRRRAVAAAAFKADVTVSLHFNTTENDSNGIVVFVPGNFLPGDGDFATEPQRYWAFLRVLDGTTIESQRFGASLGESMMRHLQLPALRPGGDHSTGRYWRPADPANGVYARNLAILRRTPGVVVLLEGPCVNQSAEYPRLQATDLMVDGQGHPGRLRAYADAVTEVLLAR